MRKDLHIGLFGFGVVGKGLHDVLTQSTGFKADIVRISIKNPDKSRTLDSSYFTTDHDELINHPDINLIVELIDDADAAFDIVKKALKSGKSVVTSNKKMLALHMEELFALQKENDAGLLYEASSCGSIPIIRNLEEYYDNELLYSVRGIFNGSSNYILSKMFNELMGYEVALKQAQELGFAETDPTLDVGGFDALYKLCILTMHAFGIIMKPEEVFNYGISTMNAFDVQFMREKGWKTKLICEASKFKDDQLTAYVMPRFIKKESRFYSVENEYNGVEVEAAFSDTQFFHGKGAGGHPTGSAVLSDISASSYKYRYEYKKTAQHENLKYDVTDYEIDIYLRYEDANYLKHFNFLDTYEKYYGQAHNYVIGRVRLSNLLSIKEMLRKMPVFIVKMPD